MSYDIGAPAIDRATYSGAGYTFITKENPASQDGPIEWVAIWAAGAMTGVKVAIFEEVAPNTFTTRSWQNIPNCPLGYSEWPVSLACKLGDFIGCYYSTGGIDRDNTGDLRWLLLSDEIPCVNKLFGFTLARTISLFGWYTTPPVHYDRFTITAYNVLPLCYGFSVLLTTDIPCHLWLRFTDTPTQKHPKVLIRRGLSISYDVRSCFVAYSDIEQEEPGDTLLHTFHTPRSETPPPTGSSFWPFYEPWGTYLTENNQWNKYKEPEVPTTTFEDGVIKIENPGYQDCGITYGAPADILPLVYSTGEPLKIAFDNPDATAESTSSQLSIELLLRGPDEWMAIYLCVACGAEHDDKKPWSTGYVAGRPYGWLFVGTGEFTIDLLDWFQTFREDLGLSTDPTDWHLNLIVFALGVMNPLITDYLKNDYIGCYNLRTVTSSGKTMLYCTNYHFYFWGTSGGAPMVYTSAIFHQHFPLGLPPYLTCDKSELAVTNAGFCQYWNANSQTFTPTHDYKVHHLKLMLNQHSKLSIGPYCVKITRNIPPCWAEPVVAYQEGSSGFLPAPGHKYFCSFMGITPTLKAGESYRIVVHTLPGWVRWEEDRWVPDESAAALRWWMSDASNPYADGAYYHGCNIRDQEGVWIMEPNYDATFRLYQLCPSLPS